MNKYEVLYIISCDIEEEAIKEIIEKFKGIVTDNGGSILDVDEWGKRRLAYPIHYKNKSSYANEGYYVLMHFESKPEFPVELERNFRINENILRFMVTRPEA